jgi:formamidopyrimidine-DNA glycosylase
LFLYHSGFFYELAMPELPEVEATVQYLRDRVEGVGITSAKVLWHRTVASKQPAVFEREIAGSTIEQLFRRGKFVGLELGTDNPLYLFVHLRMSGSLDVVSANAPLDKHDRVVLYLDNGKSIRFNDTRKFGRMYLCTSQDHVVGSLGAEPLSDDFTFEYLERVTRSKKGRIKPLLLDQTIIAGLGNIYVDESLWKARIHPLTPAHRIPTPKLVALHQSIREILAEAVSLLGTDFGDGVVQDGMYSPKVYGREGAPCQRCGSEIKRIVVGQRGTHLCGTCQPRPRKC